MDKNRNLPTNLEILVSDPNLATLEADLKNFNTMDLIWFLDSIENYGMGICLIKYFLIKYPEYSPEFSVIIE